MCEDKGKPGRKSLKRNPLNRDTLNVIKEHRMLEERIRRAQLEYRAALEDARRSGKQKSLLRVLEKRGLRDLLDKRPPPVAPSVSFFPFPFPFPFPPAPPLPGLPDPRDLAKIFPPTRRHVHHVAFCTSTQSLSVDPEEYVDLGTLGSAHCSQLGPKSVSVRASAGQSTPGNPEYSWGSCGFRSLVPVPAGANRRVRIVSTLNSSLSWVEANTHGTIGGSGGGGYAKVSAAASLTVFVNSDVIRPSPVTIVRGEVSGQDQLYYEIGLNVGSEIPASISLPEEGLCELVVEELVELRAEASDGHAFIDGSFTWDPLAIEIKEGCHMVTLELPMPI